MTQTERRQICEQICAEYVSIAAREYISRRDRVQYPEGAFDSAGRWYPSKEEHCTCCDLVRAPSRHWPYSLMLHCRTLRHIARLYNVSLDELVRAVKVLDTR